MAGVNDMLDAARKDLGLGEPNYIQRNYRARNGAAYGGNFPWCDAAITEWARKSGNHKAVCPAGDRAYTVYHAQDFQKRGQWYAGTVENLKNAKPGDIIFFDWGNTNSIGAIDHVGIVEKNLGGGRVQTIEGNISDKCMRKVREATTVAGFGRPAYTGSPSTPSEPAKEDYWKVTVSGKSLTVPWGTTELKKGSSGERVKWLQECLMAAGHSLPKFGADSDFGDETHNALRAFQSKHGLESDGVYGNETSRKLYAVLSGGQQAPAPSPAPSLPVDSKVPWYYPDLSEYEPGANIKEVLKQSGGFLCIRAGFGVGSKDKKFDQWRDQAKDAHVLMIYHFPTKVQSFAGTVAENAEYFAKLVGKVRPNEVLVLDVEPRSGKWSKADCEKYMSIVREKTGAGPMMIYANESYVGENGLSSLFTSSTGWVAKWGKAGTDASPPKWDHISHQHAADGYGKPRVRWSGTDAKTDENRVTITKAEFAKRLGKPIQVAEQNQTEEDAVLYHGEVKTGSKALTVISIVPGSATSIGFYGDNGIEGKPPAKLRVAVHDKGGWYAEDVIVDSTKPKPWFRFRDKATTDAVSVLRIGEDEGDNAIVAYDAH